jgi:hypothetical protein
MATERKDNNRYTKDKIKSLYRVGDRNCDFMLWLRKYVVGN